jgi:hypothetical protein
VRAERPEAAGRLSPAGRIAPVRVHGEECCNAAPDVTAGDKAFGQAFATISQTATAIQQ